VTSLITAAREWYDAGYTVVPTHEDGGKRPFGAWKQYQTERLPWEELHALLETGTYTGIGVLTGSASRNVEMIEIEGPLDLALKRLAKVKAQARDYAQIGVPDLLVRLAAGCAEQSAGGGLHLFYFVSDGPALGNTKLANAGGKVIAETRGEGGFVVVAPTLGRKGHAEGSAYTLMPGRTPAGTISITSEERDLLHMLFGFALDEQPTPVEPYTPSEHAGDSTSALDDYRAKRTWAEILTPTAGRTATTLTGATIGCGQVSPSMKAPAPPPSRTGRCTASPPAWIYPPSKAYPKARCTPTCTTAATSRQRARR